MKKLVAMFLALVLVVGCFAGCGAKGGNDGGEQEYKVAMVTDFGDITDQSFNQTISLLANLNIPSAFYTMLPYIISLVILVFTSEKSRAPKAEGIPYDKGVR